MFSFSFHDVITFCGGIIQVRTQPSCYLHVMMIYCVPSTVMAGAVSCIIQNRFNRRRLSFNTMIYLSCPNTSRDLPVTGDPRGSCSPREISGPVFYLWLNKVSANERRRYIYNVFSHWLRPCSTIYNKWLIRLHDVMMPYLKHATLYTLIVLSQSRHP